MIVQNIDSTTQVVFTREPSADYRNIARDLNYTKKDGNLYKYVQVEYSQVYYVKGGNGSVPCVKFSAKGINTYIISDSHDFTMSSENPHNVVNALKTFGENYILQIDGVEFKGAIKEIKNTMRDDNGKVISFGDMGVSELPLVHKMIHRLSTDNGRMLAPILQRYLNTIHLFKGNKSLLTGYAKLESYLRMLQIPTKGLFNKIDSEIDADYVIKMDDRHSQARVNVIGVRNGISVLELKMHGFLQDTSTLTSTPNPYILMTTKPIKLKNQKMPYTVVSHRGIPVFISPLIFNSDKILREMKGGINLLK
jgi:hypothetical protein